MTGAEQLIEMGRAEGLAKGRDEGRVQGRAEMLITLLGIRFGALDPGVAERVRAASLEDLDLWAGRVLTAASLNELFASD